MCRLVTAYNNIIYRLHFKHNYTKHINHVKLYFIDYTRSILLQYVFGLITITKNKSLKLYYVYYNIMPYIIFDESTNVLSVRFVHNWFKNFAIRNITYYRLLDFKCWLLRNVFNCNLHNNMCGYICAPMSETRDNTHLASI